MPRQYLPFTNGRICNEEDVSNWSKKDRLFNSLTITNSPIAGERRSVHGRGIQNNTLIIFFIYPI